MKCIFNAKLKVKVQLFNLEQLGSPYDEQSDITKRHECLIKVLIEEILMRKVFIDQNYGMRYA